MRIAYIVYTENGPFSFAGTEHDSVLQYLKDKGLDIHKEEWSDESVDWKQYQCIVLKSPWDYVAKTELFYSWLDKIQGLQILLLNDANIVRWNSNKHYLQEIATAGLKVIPTKFLEKGTKFEAGKYFKEFDTDRLIVKPCISGSSKNTFKVSAEDTSITSSIDKLLQRESMMVQPFMQQINDEGEWSLLFFGGAFSHALLKTPLKDDFRSQTEFGGIVQGKKPAPEVLNSASEYVDRFAKGCLYARVDGLIINGTFYLMELELIDPNLFLFTCAAGYENYYTALNKLIG